MGSWQFLNQISIPFWNISQATFTPDEENSGYLEAEISLQNGGTVAGKVEVMALTGQTALSEIEISLSDIQQFTVVPEATLEDIPAAVIYPKQGEPVSIPCSSLELQREDISYGGYFYTYAAEIELQSGETIGFPNIQSLEFGENREVTITLIDGRQSTGKTFNGAFVGSLPYGLFLLDIDDIERIELCS